ncbi:conserved Plasmodium protein, unknown function [Plasmodium relictum]|uniref:Uncharacterized protein n=1 Tax=Plasmodium relictum TaxID=85471 RepID=A0A1J1H5E1_PLARL|nr:conserved Plasmodium protein, unknown function [Plasmodium relictum]CRG99771.1 conserved Plasmodium protein, unknown function [Plasmodium relictum]
MKNNKIENYGSFSKHSNEGDEMNYNTHNNKKEIIKNYLNIAEEDMKEEIKKFSDNKLKSNLSYNQFEESSFIDSEENIMLTDREIKNSDDEKHLLNKKNINSSFSNSDTDIISDTNNNSNYASLKEQLNSIEYKKKHNQEKEVLEEGEIEHNEEVISEQLDEEEVIKIDTLLASNKSSELISINVEEKKCYEDQLGTNKEKNKIFEMEIEDINEWKTKYIHLTSSFRKLDKEISKIVNNEHINLLTRRSIKQHKDFLDNEYKEWLFISQKTISEFKKNISAQVSELNEKEYLILSKNIYDDFKEKNIEEININFILYLFIIKHEITIDDGLMKYLEDCYLSTNIDKALHNTIQKLIETKNNIKNIGGKTGKWNGDENNYFIKVYESNRNVGDEVIIKILKNGINRSEEEISEHISWYHKFVKYNNLKNKYINNISIINLNDKKKNNFKDAEKKSMIKKWKEKKKQESEIKKEQEQIKKEEMKMIQEHLNSKKEEMKKNKLEKPQKSILSEEMLQRINERNERILKKKVQTNLNVNEENDEKDKKVKQKYMHIQSKLLSNTGNILLIKKI